MINGGLYFAGAMTVPKMLRSWTITDGHQEAAAHSPRRGSARRFPHAHEALALCSGTGDRCAAHKDRTAGPRRDAGHRRHGTSAREILWNDRRVLDGHASAI